ncbi:MAG: hypothetical protein AB1714_26620 [Acidobacteriota bacterium]
MNRKGLAFALGFLIGLAFLAQADTQDFTFVNNTGQPIVNLFLKPTDGKDWGEDILGVDVLEDGDSVSITFAGYDDCVWDLMANDKDENVYMIEDVDLCGTLSVTLTKDNKTE